jgi:hypothetical protein
MTLIDLKLSDPNAALREVLHLIRVVACDADSIFPDGDDDELYPLVTTANVRAGAALLADIAAAYAEKTPGC